MTQRPTLQEIDEYVSSHLAETIEELAQLVARPSISAYHEGIDECAQFVETLLRRRGCKTAIMPTDGNPIVYGEWQGSGDKTLLFYLHYDVQPAEPLDLWHSPPFELTEREGMLFGRGVSDDKGHISARLAALDAVKATLGELPCTIKFVIEGEEEVGSPNIAKFIAENKELLAADACIWEFGGVNHDGTPVQALGVRGICFVELHARTASQDMHSGSGGSLAANAAWRLTWALASIKDMDDRILIEGFYDDVLPASEIDMALLEKLPTASAETMQSTYDLSGFIHNPAPGAEWHRQAVFDPTCTICGLTAGHQGAGPKTVLPATASAKLDFRLVPNQRADDIIEKLRRHLAKNGFDDIEVRSLGGYEPARTQPDDPFVKLVVNSAEPIYGTKSLVQPLVGGSGPMAAFINELHLPVLTAGIGYPGNQVHAPNENVVIENFRNGIRHTAHIVHNFGLNGSIKKGTGA